MEHHDYASDAGEGGVPGTDSNSETSYVPGELETAHDYLPNEAITGITVTEHHYYTSEEGKNGVPGTDSNDGTLFYDNDNTGRNVLGNVLALVWGSGAIILAAWNIGVLLRLRSRLKSAEQLSEVGDIKTADGIATPFLWGLFSPVIYLPHAIDAEECTYIIAHERYHRKRKDYLVKPLFFMIAVIHWFNPLVWAAYFLFVRDMEISCDEAVIASADGDIRKKYAESLLKYAARQNGYTLAPITFGEPSLRCRIVNVLHYKERNVFFSTLVLCAVLAVMAGLMVKPRRAEPTVISDSWNVSQTEEKLETNVLAENPYQVGWEYELTDAERMQLYGLVPYFGDDMDAFFDYYRIASASAESGGDTYAWICQIGRTQGFDVYGTNVIDTILVRTPDGKYVRIDHGFTSNYHEVPFIYEADFDADDVQELVIMGGFGYHGTGIYQEQLFIVDRGTDGIWRAYEFAEDIYLPMIHAHIDTEYNGKGVELLIDGEGVGHPYADEELIDASAEYGAGAHILFGYGESGIIEQFASGEDKIIGAADNPDKGIVMDAMLGIYSDQCVSGIFPGDHFLAAFDYAGDGVWSLAEYHYVFQPDIH